MKLHSKIESAILYQKKIDTIFDFNKWFNINAVSSKYYIPQNSINNTWQLQVVGFNAYNYQGCDNWVYKNLYFKIQNNLKSVSQLNNEDTIGKANNVKMLCNNVGVFLNPVLGNQNENRYRIKIEEIEYATWINPASFITYYRQLPDVARGVNSIKKVYAETFDKKFNSSVDLEKFWIEKNGYKMDKSKVYKVSLITYDDKDSLIDTWRFSFYQCSQWVNNINENSLDKQYDYSKSNLIILENKTTIENKNSIKLESVELFPNPTNSNLNLIFNNINPNELNINITNIEGKELINNIAIQDIIANNKVILNLSEFNSGTYFIKIITNNSIYVRKVIKL